jgi:two-component system, chemotaxis family, CheB/CheR fusion protein
MNLEKFLGKHMKISTGKFLWLHGIIFLSFIVYGGIFLLTYRYFGPGVASFSFLPIVIIAWAWGGIKNGLIAGVVTMVFTTLLFIISGEHGWFALFRHNGLPGSITAVTLGGIVGYLRDLREKVNAQLEDRKKADASFRAMFEVTTEGVSLVSVASGRIVAVNPALCKMFGYTENEFLDMDPLAIAAPETHEHLKKALASISAQGSIPDREGIGIAKNGSRIDLFLSSRNISWRGEDVIYTTYRDISQQKLFQEQLQKKNTEVLNFTNDVTHDLRKPLTALKVIISMADKGMFGDLNNDGKESVAAGLKTISYMQELLDDLLECARLETGIQTLRIEKFLINELFTQMLKRFEYQIKEKNISFSVGECEIPVSADRNQISRVLMNLVANAVAYIGKGPNCFISIRCEKKGDEVVIAVSDNGIGIPADSQAALFSKFKRGSNVGDITGTGLGLTIAKSIVDAHGGKIWFESTAGIGTVFYFTVKAG